MSLLDQLVNFCNPSIAVSLVQSPSNKNQSPHHYSRNHSLNITTKSINQRYSKSIDKLGTWMPSSREETKHRILLKLSATIKNKVRKHSYNFWVNLEHNLKEKRKKEGQEQKHSAKMKSGIEKLIEFSQSFQSKKVHLTSLSKGFRSIKKKSTKILSIKHLERAIKPLISETYQLMMQIVKQREKNILKAELLASSIQMTIIKNVKLAIFQHLGKDKTNNKSKGQQTLQISIKKTPILIQTHKGRSSYLMQQEFPYQLACKQRECFIKNICKVAVDSFAENFPETSDNSYLFIEKPTFIDFIEDQNSFQTEFRIIQEVGSTPRSSIYSNTKNQKQKIHVRSHFRYEQIHPSDKYQYEKHVQRKSFQCTPQNRSIQSSSILNIDQRRLAKLERKIFGIKNKSQNPFQVNGQDWKDDKKALQQIIDLIKSPPKMRRNSIFQLEVQRNKGAKEEENNHQLRKDSRQTGKFSQKSLKIREDNMMMKNSLMNDLREHEKSKCQQKILISLKSKKRESLTVIPGNLGKSEHWRKLYEGEKEGKTAIVGHRK